MNITSRMEPASHLLASHKKAKNYDYNLEGLRGFTALIVAISHAFGIKNLLDPAYHPNAYWLSIGHGAVLVFFLLSGYVIGLTNTEKFSKLKATSYLIRRSVRLLPIYLIAVVLGILISQNNSLISILGNVTFLQNYDSYFGLSLPPIEGNSPVWSLNHEVVYYLFFLLVWYLRPNLIVLIGSIFVVSVIGWVQPQFPQFVSSYASGEIFWLVGLWIAWRLPRREENRDNISIPLLSYLLLFYATNNLNVGKVILYGLGFLNPTVGKVNLADVITVLPICILLIATVTGRKLRGLVWLQRLSFAIPMITLVLILLKGRLAEPRWIPTVLLLVLAIALLKNKSSMSVLAFFAPLGRISYGFYLLHYPLLFLFRDYFPWRGSIWSFALRLVMWLVVTVIVSYLLELVVQPIIKNWFYRQYPQKHLLKTD